MAEVIKTWRKRRGLTQEQAADLVQATQSAWNSWEQGRRPQIHFASRLHSVSDGEISIEGWGEPPVKDADSGPHLTADPPAKTGS